MTIHTNTNTAPIRSMIEQFYGEIFKHADRTKYVVVRGIDEGVAGAGKKQAFVNDVIALDDPQFMDVILEHAKTAGAWLKPAVFAGALATFLNKTAVEKAVHEGLVLSVDCDKTPVKAQKILTRLLGQPSLVVYTGGEWDNPDDGSVERKVHLHWRLKTPVTGQRLADLREARKLATNIVGGDTSCIPLSHLFRIAGTAHTKKRPPRRCEMEVYENEIDLDEALEILRAVTPAVPAQSISERAKANVKPPAPRPDDAPNPFRNVNAAALEHRELWVFALFERFGPNAVEYHQGADTYRISSKVLNRPNEEDISIARHGIMDWGVYDLEDQDPMRPEGLAARLRPGQQKRGGRTAIDLVVEYNACSPSEALLWLCERMGIAPASIGWNDQKTPDGAVSVVTIDMLPALTIAEWRAREDLSPPDFLLGHFLTTTSRILLTATTGLGKTNFCVGLAIRSADGAGFLHWQGRRKARVLYIDGEMARRLFWERIEYECRRAGVEPDTIFFLSKEDLENMPPLNTPEGQAYMDAFIEKIGGVDLIVFDNIMCLLIGDMKEPAAWQAVSDWTKSLTKRCIGQIWVHHTGIDETRSYGDKSKEWALDTCIHLDAKKREDTDVSFTLKFGKARERTPDTREDFRDIDICLLDGEWSFERSVPKKEKPKGWTPALRLIRDAVNEAILAHGFKYRVSGDGPEVIAVEIARVRAMHKRKYVNTGDGDRATAERQAWKKFETARRHALIGTETSKDERELVWIIKEN